MHVILTGATGRVGAGVLDAMLQMPDLTKITVISRKPVPQATDAKDPRVEVIQHADFATLGTNPSILEAVKGAKGCVWAMGISQTEVSKEDYVKITKDYTLSAAEAFGRVAKETNQPFRFVYVSGEGATHTPSWMTPIFGRVKGETELALAAMRKENPLFWADTVRPGGVDTTQHAAIKPYVWQRETFARKAMYASMFPPMRLLYSSMMAPTLPMGTFMAEMAAGKWDGKLEGPGVEKIGETGGKVLSNAAWRRLAGL